MQRTKIHWADFSINPVKGLCPVDCKDNQGKSYCYARRMYKRFKWNPEIRYVGGMYQCRHIKKPSRIFVGSTIELFGDWIDRDALRNIFNRCKEMPQHTFIFLTKQPQNLIKWSPFPENTYIGVSVTANGDMTLAMTNLQNIKAGKRFISFEPLLGCIGMKDHMSMKGIIDWIILGSQTQPVKHPSREWVEEIITAADNAKIPVFIKEPLASHLNIHRQEFPA